ncbi:hypothetical protein JCM9803A_15990 [Rhodococcus erythropolis]
MASTEQVALTGRVEDYGLMEETVKHDCRFDVVTENGALQSDTTIAGMHD